MSKLLKLKEWVTVAEAARHLSIVLGEEVREADLYQLALDERLVLSIRFPEPVYGYRVEYVDPDDKTQSRWPGPMLSNDAPLRYVGTAVESIDGVLDLPMIGGERVVVRGFEWSPGSEFAEFTFDEVLLRTSEGVLFCLMTLKPDAEARPFTSAENYTNSYGLPADARFVVRTSALAALLASVTEAHEPRPDLSPALGKAEATKGLSTVERQSLLKLVLGMAMEGYRYSPDAARNEATADIAADLAKHGLQVSDDTVLKWLKEAARTCLLYTS